VTPTERDFRNGSKADVAASVCDVFSFPGSKGFIEAHHLKAITTLEEGVAVTYDIAADFAVLCSNCPRMIHRYADPSDLKSFRAAVSENKS
jgi:predicted HNH restriction endonuclease